MKRQEKAAVRVSSFTVSKTESPRIHWMRGLFQLWSSAKISCGFQAIGRLGGESRPVDGPAHALGDKGSNGVHAYLHLARGHEEDSVAVGGGMNRPDGLGKAVMGNTGQLVALALVQLG